MFIYTWESEKERKNEQGKGRERERERGRHRIWSRLQALSGQHRAQHGTRTHGPRDHDLSWSRTLNWLSHPDAPILTFLIWFSILMMVIAETSLTIITMNKKKVTSMIFWSREISWLEVYDNSVQLPLWCLSCPSPTMQTVTSNSPGSVL